MLIQMDLFKENSEIEMLEEKVRLIENSLEKQRKSQFAKIGELNKRYIELNDRFNVLERALCKGKFGGFE